MALVLKDRVKETTTTTGTGTVTLAGAAAGFQSFVVIGDGNQTFYAIVDATSGAWEVGVGTYTSSGTTLSRTTVVSSSNAGSLVNFGAGSKDVFVTYPSSRAVYLDAAGSAVTTLDIGTLGTSTANISTANITAGTVATAPVNNTDIVNKEYADAIASGIHFHEAVNLATTAALPANTYNNGTSGVGATLTGNANGALSVDSTLTTVSERILVKNEAAGANNGVYTVTQVGSAGTPYILTRATDFDSVGTGVDQIDEGDFFLVTSGTANVNTAWVQQTPPPITIGTTAIVFQQFSAPITYTAGTGLNESPTYTFNIANIGTAGTYGSASSVPVITTNAQGQVTGVTNTAIAISGAAVSGNISGSAGSVTNALTAGSFLTSGGTFDGSAARTFAVDATSANTASKVVARDASGNFSAGTITATLSGAATSATTATNLAGGAANRIAYQTGAGATTFAVAPTASNQVLNWNGSAFTWSAGTISGIALGSNLATLTFGTYLTGTSYNGSTAVTLATNATNANTASTIVARDASGNFSAGTITAALSGNATTSSSTTGNAATVSSITGNTALIVNRLTPTTSVDGLTTANFRSTLFGTSSNGAAIATGRWDSVPAPLSGLGLYGTMIAWGASDTQGFLAMDYSSGNAKIGGGNANSINWTATLLHSSNYTSYAPSLTGSGASGTWGINVTGNAATATNATQLGGYAASTYVGQFGNSYYQVNTWLQLNGAYGLYWPSQYGAHLSPNDLSTYTQLALRGSKGTYGGLYDQYSAVNGMMYDSSGNGGVYREANGRWYLYHSVGNNCLGVGTSATNSAYGIYSVKGIYAEGLIRAGTNFYADQNYGYGLVGAYSSTIFQGVFAMGDAYKLTPAGAINNLYGMTWSYPSAGGIAGNLDSHGLIVAINGGFGSCLSYNVKASANVTAYSDERLKRNWEPLCDNFVEKLAGVKVGTYERIDLPIVQVGVSAQSLEKVLPEAVSTATDDLQTKSVAYGNAALASAVMLAQEVVELKKMMKQMQAELAELKRGM